MKYIDNKIKQRKRKISEEEIKETLIDSIGNNKEEISKVELSEKTDGLKDYQDAIKL